MTQPNSYKVTVNKSGHVLTSTIYGNITPERIDAAKKALQHRADQLFFEDKPKNAGWYRPERQSYSRRDEFMDDEFMDVEEIEDE